MAITITIELNRELDLPAGYDEVFDLLADVPKSAAHFPKLHELVDLGDNTYRWEMEKIGVDRHSIQSIYACRYQDDRDAGRITWEPVKGEGNGLVQGSWTIQRKNDSTTHASFRTNAELTLPLPGMLKLAISPVVKHQFNDLVDQYMENLKKAF